MRTLIINSPGTIDLNDKEAKMVLASKLYELGNLTLGQAAELVGYTKGTFMELLADYDVSFFNYSPDELDEDIKNADDTGCLIQSLGFEIVNRIKKRTHNNKKC